MAINYVLTKKGNPRKPKMPKKWYAHATSTGSKTLKQISREIAKRCTPNYADTLDILENLTQMLMAYMAEGKIVRLGNFGSFQIALKSEGAEMQDQFNAALIRKTKIVFRPSEDAKKMLNNLEFENIKADTP
jgi:predicted histone-like DNA-binding protein